MLMQDLVALPKFVRHLFQWFFADSRLNFGFRRALELCLKPKANVVLKKSYREP